MPKHPITYAPRGLRAEQAAIYLGMGRSKFLELVEARKLPQPKIVDGMKIWDRHALDSAFDDFPERGESDNVTGRPNSFDEVLRGS